METTPVLSEHPQFDSAFIEQIFSNCDISYSSRRDYLQRIGRFHKFVQANGGLNRNSLLDFKRSLTSDNSISVSTKNKFLIVAKIFVQQLFRLGITKVDLSSGVKGFRSSTGFKTNGFTDDEIGRIVAGINELKDIRLKSILTLLMFSGLRQIEIIRLMVEHVNVADGIISVHGKGRDGLESLPIVPQVINVLRDYLGTTKKKSGHLFTSESKRNRGKGLTTKTVWLIVREFLDSIEIDRNPHQFRSFFTTNLVRKMGNNLFDVIVYTRHRNISTLQHYVNQLNREKTLPKFQNSFSDFVLN